MRQLSKWLEIAFILVISAVGMAFMTRQFCNVTPPVPSGTVSVKQTQEAVATVAATAGSNQKECLKSEKRYRLIPSAVYINGIFMGLSSKDLEARLGPALLAGTRNWGGRVLYYRHVTLELNNNNGKDLPRVYAIWGTELQRGGRVLLKVGDSRAEVFKVFPDACSIRPHPFDTTGRPDIYDSAGSHYHLIKDPQALELVILTTLPNAEESGMIAPYICRLYAVLTDGRIKRINAQHIHPVGKPRFFINP
ncbi:MAG: hypothetical protein AB9903_28710 [Vulcanimicrobiota bacterium]